MQLHSLLGSLKANCDMFDSIHIIVKWSDDDFKKGYMKLIQKKDKETYWFENNKEILKSRILQLMTSEYTCFMVDDLIAYTKLGFNNADFKDGFIKLMKDDVCFSLRMGGNIRLEPADTYYNAYGVLRYDWTKHSKYWGYPFSVDGHIFRTDYIKPIINKIIFNNPNKLEAHLQGHLPKAPKHMLCFSQSIVVSVPINRVSDTASAVFGEKYPYTAKKLNDKFLDGERIDWELMDFSDIKVPHQEVDLKFKGA